MFTLLNMGVGAAAVKLLNRKGGSKLNSKEKKELIQEQQNLQRLVAALELEALAAREVASAATKDQQERARQLEELRQQADELKVQVDKLATENVDLLSTSNLLKDTVHAHEEQEAALRAHNEELIIKTTALSSEKEQLCKEMECLKDEHDATVKAYQEQLEDLRGKVSNVVTRMLANSITDADAVEAVRALGCQIEYIEAPPSVVEAAPAGEGSSTPAATKDLTWQPGLLLEDRERLQKLVVSGMMRNLEGGRQPARIPMVTFPVRPLGSIKSDAKTTPGLLTRTDSSSALKVAGSIEGGTKCDVGGGQRDQAPAAGAASPAPASRTKKAPSICVGTPSKASDTSSAVKFTYSLQGSKGSAWVAKVPMNDEPAAPAFNIKGGGGLIGLDQLDDHFDTGLSGSRSLVTKS